MAVSFIAGKCDGNPDDLETAELIADVADDVYDYEVSIALDAPFAAAGTISLDIAGTPIGTITTNTTDIVYTFTSTVPLAVATAGTLTATSDDGCVGTFEVVVADDCSCTREYCGDVTDTGDSALSFPDAALPSSGANPLLMTYYILVDPASGTVLATDTDLDPVPNFDLAALALPEGICEVWAVNFDVDGQAYVDGSGTLDQLCNPTDPCLCISVSSSACYVEKLAPAIPPTPTNAFACQGGTYIGAGVTGIEATCLAGETVAWYTAETGGAAIATTAIFDVLATTFVDVNTPGTTTFYAECISADGCLSPRSAVTITVNPSPDAPDPVDQCICADGAFDPIALNVANAGSTYNVYAADQTTLLLGAVAPMAGVASPIDVSGLAAANLDPATAGTYQLYISEINSDGCESALALVELTVLENPDPALGAAGPFFFCNNDGGSDLNTLTMPVTAGGEWFVADAAGDPTGSAVAAGFVPMDFAPGDYMFVYVIESTSAIPACAATICTAQSAAVTLTVCEIGDPTWTAPGSYCAFEAENGIALDPFVAAGVTAANTWTLEAGAGGTVTDAGDGTAIFSIADAAAVTECTLYTIRHSVTTDCNAAGDPATCVEFEDQILEVCPELDPTFSTACVCCDEDPYFLPGGGNLANPGGFQDLPVAVSADPTGSWTGSGVFVNDGGTPTDPSDDLWYFDPRVDEPAGSLTPFDPAATGQFITSEGEWTIQFQVGEQPCEREYILDWAVSCPVDVTLNPATTCVSPSNSVNLSGLFDPATTQGGLWCIDPAPVDGVAIAGADGVAATADGLAETTTTVGGSSLNYDINSITEITTVDIKYSVGNACAGGNCVGVGQTTITLIPTPQPYFVGDNSPNCASDADYTVTMFDALYGESGDDLFYTGAFSSVAVAGPAASVPMDGVANGLLTFTGNSFVVSPTAILANPDAAGTYEITYDVTFSVNGVDCPATVTTQITVYPSYDACFTVPTLYCAGDAIDLVSNAIAATSFDQTPEQISIWTVTADGVTTTLTNDVGTTDVTGWIAPAPGVYTVNHSLGHDICQTECVAVIEVKAPVDATIADTEICVSTSGQTGLTALFGATTTTGGTFTLVSSANGNTVSVAGSELNYDPNGTFPDVVTVQYEVGDANCCIGGCDSANDLADCHAIATAEITLNFGVQAFLDLPETMCSDEELCDLYNYLSLTDAEGNVIPTTGVLGDFDVVAMNINDGNGYVAYDPLTQLDADGNPAAGDVTDDNADNVGDVLTDCYIPNDKFEGWVTIRFTSEDPDLAQCVVLFEDNIQIIRGGTADFKNPAPVCAGDGAIDLSTLTMAPLYTGDGTPCGVFAVLNEDGSPSADLTVVCNPSTTPGFPDECSYNWDPINAGGTTVTITYTVGTGDCADMISMEVPVCETVSAEMGGPIELCQYSNKAICGIDYLTGTAPYETKIDTVLDLAIYAVDTIETYEDINGDDLIDTLSVILWDTIYSATIVEYTCQNGMFEFGPGLTVTDADSACVLIDADFTGETYIVYKVGKNLDYDCDGAPDAGFDCSGFDNTTCFAVDTLTITIDETKLDPTFDLANELCVTDSTYIVADPSPSGLTNIMFAANGGEDLDQIFTPPSTFDISVDGDSLLCDSFTPDDLIDVVTIPEDTICGPNGFLKDMNVTIRYRMSAGCGTAQGDHDGFSLVGPAGITILTAADNTIPPTTDNGFAVVTTVDDSDDDLFQIDIDFAALVGEYAAQGLDLNEVMATNCEMPLEFVYTLITNAAGTNIDLEVDFIWTVIKNDFSIAICDPADATNTIAINGTDGSDLFYYGVDSIACTDSVYFDLAGILNAFGENTTCPVKVVITNEAASCNDCTPSYCDTLTIFPQPDTDLVCDYSVDVCSGAVLDLTTLLSDPANVGGTFTWVNSPAGPVQIGAGMTVTSVDTVIVPAYTYTDANGLIVFVDENIYVETTSSVEGMNAWDTEGLACGIVEIAYVQEEVVCNGESVSIVPPCAGASDTISLFITTPIDADSIFASNASPYKCIGTDDLCITLDGCNADWNITLRDSEDYDVLNGFPGDVTVTTDTLAEGECGVVSAISEVCIDLSSVTVPLDGLWSIVVSGSNACGASEEQSQDVYFIQEVDVVMAPATICSSEDDFNLTTMVVTSDTNPNGGTFTIDGVTVNGNEISDLVAGSYDVCYAVGTEGACFDSACETLTIIEGPEVAFTTDFSGGFVCAGDDIVVNYSGTAAADTSYVLSDTDGGNPTSPVLVVGGTAQFVTGTLDGLYTICVTATNDDCTDTECIDVYVVSDANAGDHADVTVCVGESVDFTTLQGDATATPGGSYSGGESYTGVTGAGSFDVVYSVGVEGACFDTDTLTVTVLEAPDPSFTTNASPQICEDDALMVTPNDMSAVSTSLTFANGVPAEFMSGMTITDIASYTGPGLYEICHTVANDVAECSSTWCTQILVTAAPQAAFTTDEPVKVCEDNGTIDLTEFLSIESTTNSTGYFAAYDADNNVILASAPWLNGNTVDPSGAATDTLYVWYQVQDGPTASPCFATDILTIIVTPAPTGEFMVDSPVCTNNSMGMPSAAAIVPTASADPLCNDEGTFTITDADGNEVASFPNGGGYAVPQGTYGTYTVTYKVGEFFCEATTSQTVEVCAPLTASLDTAPDFCEGEGSSVDLNDYVLNSSVAGTWVPDPVSFPLTGAGFDGVSIVNVSNVAAGTAVEFTYVIASDCDEMCSVEIPFVINIDEVKWNPKFDLTCAGCDGGGVESTVDAGADGSLYLCTNQVEYAVEFDFGAPVDTIVFSGQSTDIIETTEGSNFQPANPNIGDGAVCVVAPEDYFCGRRNTLLDLEFTYNYVGLPDPFDPSIITNGDYDTLYISGPGNMDFCLIASDPSAPGPVTNLGQPGIPVHTEGNPGNPNDETFGGNPPADGNGPDRVIPFADILAAYDAATGGNGQAFLDSLFSTCEPLVFNYYLVTRAAPVSITLSVVADVEITKNSSAAYDADGNALPDGHYVVDEATGNATFVAQLVDGCTVLSDLADLAQPITIVDTTFDCAACAGDDGVIFTQDIYFTPEVNTAIAGEVAVCADELFSHINLDEILPGFMLSADDATSEGCELEDDCTFPGATTPGGTWDVLRGVLEYDLDGNWLLDVSSLLPTEQELAQCYIDVPVTYTLEGLVADGDEMPAGCTDCGGGSVSNAVIRVYITPEEVFTSNASPFLCVGDTLTIDISDKLETVTSVTVVNGDAAEVFADVDGNYNYVIPTMHNGEPYQGLYTIVVEGTFGPCTVSEEQNIFIVAVPDATVNDLTVCEGTVNLTGMVDPASTPAGSFTIDGVANAGNEAELAAGTYAITYSVGNIGCYDEGSATLTVVAGPDASFVTNGAPFICEGDALTVTPAGSGTTTSLTLSAGGTDVAFDFASGSTAGLSGLYTITHAVENTENGITCSDEVSMDIFVVSDADATISDLAVCEGTVNLTTMVDATSTPGGSFAIDGAGNAGNEVDLAAGTYTITYSVGAEGCLATGTATLTVSPYMDPTATVQETVCAGGSISIVPNGSFGSVSGTLVAYLTGDAATGFGIDAATPEGLYSFIHSTPAPCGDDAVYYVYVYGAPYGAWAEILNAPYNNELCTEDDNIDLTQYLESESTAGGDFSGTGVIGNTFYPATAGAGVHTVTYTVSTPAGCEASFSMDITVEEPPVASFDVPDGNICIGCIVDLGSVLDLNQASDLREVWTVTGPDGSLVTGAIVNGTFVPVAGAGTYTITHDVSFGFTCSDSYTATISVSDNVSAGTPGGALFCEMEDEIINLNDYLGGTPDAGGMWTDADGNVISEFVDVATLTESSTTFTYTVGDLSVLSCDFVSPGSGNAGGCISSTVVVIQLNPIVDATFEIVGLDSPVCTDADAVYEIDPTVAPTVITSFDSSVSDSIYSAPESTTLAAGISSGTLTPNPVGGSTPYLNDNSILTDLEINISYQPVPNPITGTSNPAAHSGYEVTGPDGTVIFNVPAPGPFDFGPYFDITLDFAYIDSAYTANGIDIRELMQCNAGSFVFDLVSNSAQFVTNLEVTAEYIYVPGFFTVNGEFDSGFISQDLATGEFSLNIDSPVDTCLTVCYTTAQCSDALGNGCSAESCQTIDIFAPLDLGGLADVEDICDGLAVFFIESIITPTTLPGGTFTIGDEALAAGAAVYNGSLLSLQNLDFGDDGVVEVTITYAVDDYRTTSICDGTELTPPCDSPSETVTFNVYESVDPSFYTNASPSICNGAELEITTVATQGETTVLTMINNGVVDFLNDGATVATNDDGTTTYSYTIPEGFDGLYYITHSVTNGACEETQVTPIYVVGQASAVLVADMEVCEDAVGEMNLFSLLAADATGGGLFYVNGQYQQGVFTPLADVNEVVYVVGTEGSACQASDTMTIIVNATPDLSYLPSDICAGASAIALTGADGFTVNGADATDFDPATEGSYTIVATNATGCSATATVNVYGTPAFNLPASASICEGDIIDLSDMVASTGTTAGGTWSGFQVEYGDISESGTNVYYFDGNDLGGFINTLTYTVGTGDCEASATVAVVINEAPSAAFFLPSSLCFDDEAYLLVGLGTFTDEAGNVITSFDPSQGAGTYTVTQSITDGGCTASYSASVEVFGGAASAAWCVVDGETGEENCNGELFSFCDGATIILSPVDAGGNWTCANGSFGTDADGNTVFQYDLGGALSGSFAVTYEIPGSCGASGTKVINIFAAPEAPEADEELIYGCIGEEAEPATVLPKSSYDIVIVWGNADGTDQIAIGEVGQPVVYTPGVLTEPVTSAWFSSRNSLTGCESGTIMVTWEAEDASAVITGGEIVQCADEVFTMCVDATDVPDGVTYTWYLNDSTVYTTMTPCLEDITVTKKAQDVIFEIYYTTPLAGCTSTSTTYTLVNYNELFVTYTTIADQNAGTYDIIFTIEGGSGDYTYDGAAVDGFTYVVEDIALGTDYGYQFDDAGSDCVAIGTVIGPDAFSVNNDEFETMEDESIVCMTILGNDPGAVSIVSVDETSAQGGSIILIGSGDCDVQYTPADGYCGPDSFTYVATDNQGNELTATVNIVVICDIQLDVLTEIECDKTTGTFNAVLTILNATDNTQWKYCEDSEWSFLTITDGQSNIVDGPHPSDQGINSAYCVEIRDLGMPDVIYTYADDSVSCVKTAVELIAFDGKVLEEGNELFWSTASELDNDYFTIERSLDGVNFEAILHSQSQGNSNVRTDYTDMDFTAPVGISYYRLLVTDIYGNTELVSRVIALERTAGDFIVNVSPVPSSDMINLTFTAEQQTIASIKIVDVAGKLINERTVETVDGLTNLQIDIRTYAAGTYFLTVTQDNQSATTRFIKE